jgi:hypothetical protein
MDTDLASYIPSAVEKLSLRFSRSLPFLHDINDWIKHTSDGTWLPHFKSFFQLTVDPKRRVGGLEGGLKSVHWTRELENPPRKLSATAFDMEFENKRRVSAITSLRPPRLAYDLFFHCRDSVPRSTHDKISTANATITHP